VKYVSLHHHTTYSYMDGYGLPETHFQRAADLGMDAIAMTEHGNVSSHVKAEQASAKTGVKSIFGLEAYTAPDNMREEQNQRKWHLTILAMDDDGYQTLNRLVTRSWREGFYRWPTITGSMLKEDNKGLIVLSGCADSKVACDLLGGKGREKGDQRDAIKSIQAFKRILGDRFYLEVQQFPELGRAHDINTWYEQQSRRLGVPLVASSDCHYPVFADNEMQKILHAAGRNIGTVEAAEASWEYNIPLTLPESDAAIYKRLRGTGLSRGAAEQAILNTAEIAGRCNVTLPKMEFVQFPVEKDDLYKPGMSEVDLLKAYINKGWYYREYNKRSARERVAIKKQIAYEFDLVVQKNYTSYFLMTSYLVSRVKDKKVTVGPGRGSAAASIIVYLLRINEVDPTMFPMMMFERFIDPNRHDLPDIDLDFDDERRDEVRQEAIDLFGEDFVGNIGTFTKYKGKNSMDDVGRVFEVPKTKIEHAKSFLVERSSGDTRFGDSIADTVEMFPQVKELFDEYPVMQHTIALEGNYKGMGVHAAGVVIGAEPLWKVLASYHRMVNGKDYSVMSVDKYDGEYLGLLKMDVLSLTTLNIISRCINMIGMDLEELYKLPLDDEKTIGAFGRGDVVGVFQFEGRTTRMVTQEVAPDHFMELADINALSRPGPLHSGQTGEYIAIKHGRGTAAKLHPIVDELTEGTHGQIIYQEQILAICRRIGQFPWTHAAEIRKIIAQKKGEAAFNAKRQDFLDGAATIGVPEPTADKIWKNMVTAGAYAFNVAHCISYAMLAYWCMYLKVHHPVAFYAASLQKVPNDKDSEDKRLALMRDAQSPKFGRDIPTLGPDVRLSGANWEPDFKAGTIRSGYVQIPGIGEKTAQSIEEFKKTYGEFQDWDDLILIKGIGKKTVERIREFSEAVDPFGATKLQRIHDEIVEFIEEYNSQQESPLDRLPLPNIVADDIPYEPVRQEFNIVALIKSKNPQELFENHRSRTGEVLDPATVKDPHLKDYMTIYAEDPGGLMTVKCDRWRFPRFKNQLINAREGRDWLVARVVKKPFYGKTVHIQDMWIMDGES
jgi:DNA polymerase-3 subunit alpha